MQTVSAQSSSTAHSFGIQADGWWPWIIVALGASVMYLPSFYDLFAGIWSTDQQGHGPIVLAISIWLLYRKWPQMMAASEGGAPSRAGWPVLVFGLLLFVVGRSQDILLFEIGSVIWVLVAVLLLMCGGRAVKAVWFPLFFMLFMIPLPGAFVDAMTMPMKMAVSYVAEHVLYAAGYPIARTGVVLQIGPYQLLVADACAGLHTLFTLEALGLLYLNLVRHESVARNLTLALLIVPISFTANVIRVMALTLITYHLGDEAGQGFLHGFAGMVLFLTALLLIIGVDSLIRLVVARSRNTAD
ncbi:exosortase B [Nitrogeniibacter mangrovi]|uniref:exosortase B n=1 Tax=Nitrogeniibacter mangrovi TaxID=2016596 RepID=UPI001C2D9BAD|nr:exosortase B [Nitrogeniibacter mangrovi]